MDPAVGRLNDRRAADRQSMLEDHGIISTRLRPGRDAQLRNISAGGALVETAQRLVPGAAVGLTFETNDRWASVRGRVVRCEVSRVLATSVSYLGGVEFSAPLFWLPKDRSASESRQGA